MQKCMSMIQWLAEWNWIKHCPFFFINARSHRTRNPSIMRWGYAWFVCFFNNCYRGTPPLNHRARCDKTFSLLCFSLVSLRLICYFYCYASRLSISLKISCRLRISDTLREQHVESGAGRPPAGHQTTRIPITTRSVLLFYRYRYQIVAVPGKI